MAAVLCFGEVLLRLSPTGGRLLRQPGDLERHVGGAEANVAVALANLGRPARMLSLLPANALGRSALEALAAQGVDTSLVGTGPGRMGLYFATPAAGLRQGEVLYDRQGSAFSFIDPRQIDFDAALDGVGHLHLTGISLAVSETAAQAARALAETARGRGISISFDGNFRPALWRGTGRDPQEPIAALVSLADILFGNHKDVSLLLGQQFGGDGSQRRREAALAAFGAFPNLSLIASTARHVEDGSVHRITGRIDTPDCAAESGEVRISGIVDRIGTGDAFASGILHGWLSQPNDLDSALELGLALSALKHATPGDFSLASTADAAGVQRGSRDVDR